jgi:hypothetical protein
MAKDKNLTGNGRINRNHGTRKRKEQQDAETVAL